MKDKKQKKLIVALAVIAVIWGGVTVIGLYARYGKTWSRPSEPPPVHPSSHTETSLTEADLPSKPVAPKQFDPGGIASITKNKVGDVVRGMRIVSMGPFRERASKMDLENLHIIFSGKVTLTGSYYVTDVFNEDVVAFGVVGKEREKLPRLDDDTADSESFCFPSSNETKKYFGSKYGHGKATIEINRFDIIRYPSESACNDKFVKIISVEKTKSGNEKDYQSTINTDSKSITSSPILLNAYKHGTFSVPSSILPETKIALKWTSDQDTLRWGNIATVCLIGLDDKKQPIKLKENKGSCYPDLQFLLAETKLSSGMYEWLSSRNNDKFVTSPQTYQLSVRVLDALSSEGHSGWSGLISESTSNEFTFEPSS